MSGIDKIDTHKLDLAPLSNQVAGHPAGVQTLQSGKLVVKDCLDQELVFYRALKNAISEQSESRSRQAQLLARLHHYTPEFHGSWLEYAASLSDARVDDDVRSGPQRIVLENLTWNYDRPNVCDIKLGTQLWDGDASEEKKRRMEQASNSTTSGMCGLRLTGWQVWDDQTETYHNVPKTFGKTIQAPDLIIGARMLLASPKAGDAERAESILAGSSRVRLAPPPHKRSDGIEAALVKEESGFYLPELPSTQVRSLLEQSVLPTLKELVEIFSELEVRIRGGSLLLIFEGSAEGLEQGLGSKPRTISTGRLPVRDGVLRLVDLRMIDFAHATLVEGQGPDQGVLLGLKTTQQLFQSVLDDLEDAR